MATLPGKPGVRHLFRKSLKNDSASNICLTCKDNCDYSENIISPLYDAYVQVVIYILIIPHKNIYSTALVLIFQVLTYSLYLTTILYGPWTTILEYNNRYNIQDTIVQHFEYQS